MLSDVAIKAKLTPGTEREGTHQPSLLTGGGKQGQVGEPRLTQAGWDALAHRLARLVASLGPPPGTPASLHIGGEGAEIGFALVCLLRDAERRIPGIWAMDIDAVRLRGAEAKPPWADRLLATGEVEFVRDPRPDKRSKGAGK